VERPAASAPIDATTPVPQPRRGGLDATFLVTADTHFGFRTDDDEARDPVREPQGLEKLVKSSIEQMNGMPGKSWPVRSWGKVARPRGVFVAGDLTESGTPVQWRNFQTYFGLKGGDGLLDYPVFEMAGNHDYNRGWYVRRGVEKRHGERFYGVDWGDLHVACVGIHPNEDALRWLAQDLDKVGADRPVVVVMHYPLLGPFSNDKGAAARNTGLASVLYGYNVVGIFHGHFHASGQYGWLGYDVYNVGSVKHDWKSFAVVRITDDRFVVASWNTVSRGWWWWHEKPINGADGTPRRMVVGTPPGAEPPWMP